MSFISKFNPYHMEDKTILDLAVGREGILHSLIELFKENQSKRFVDQNILIYGPRGIGKSFFLKYFKIHFEKTEAFTGCKMILLPEEQNNIAYPADLVINILNEIGAGEMVNHMASWEANDEVWEENYAKLAEYCKSKKEENPNFILIVAIENFEILIDKFNSPYAASRLCQLLGDLDGFCLLATSTKAKIETNCETVDFDSFKTFSLREWEEEDYFQYFNARYTKWLENNEAQLSDDKLQRAKSKLKAISLFTGGSPRIATVLTNLLLTDDVISTAHTLRGLLDDLTPYYQDLLKSIPNKSKILFDTLIRCGENKSQTELAEMLNLKQSVISRPFQWLLENTYVKGTKPKGEKRFLYSVCDRMFVLYYNSREANRNYTPIWLLSDFLVVLYDKEELKEKAKFQLENNPNKEAIELAKVFFKAFGFESNEVPTFEAASDYLEFINNTNDMDRLLEEKGTDMLLTALGMSKASNFDSAIKTAKEGLQIFLDSGLKENAASIAGLLAWNLSACQDYKGAIHYFELAMGIDKELKSVKKEAVHLGQIGLCYGKMEDFETSIDFHKKAYHKFRVSNNRKEQLWNLGKIGLAREALDRHAEALNSNKQALIIAESIGQKERQAWFLSRIAFNFFNLDQHESAIEFLEEAYKFSVEIEDHKKIAWILGQMGFNYSKLGNYEKAEVKYLESLDQCRKINDWQKEAWTLGQIAFNYKDIGQMYTAFEKFKEQKKIYIEKEEKVAEKWCNDQIGVIYNDDFDDVISVLEQKTETEKATKLAINILEEISQNPMLVSKTCLMKFFINLLKMDVNHDVFHNIVEASFPIFPKHEERSLIEASSRVTDYIQTGKDPNFLNQLTPDMAIVVVAIADEIER